MPEVGRVSEEREIEFFKRDGFLEKLTQARIEGFTFHVAWRILGRVKMGLWGAFYIFHRAREIPDGGTYLEVGSHRGGSLLSAYLATKEMGTNVNFIVVEPFIEKMPDGETTERRFRENTKDIPRLKLMKTTSDAAYTEIPDNSVNLILIDGNHSYPQVKRDFEHYWPKLKRGGFLLGHDYGRRKTVVIQAAAEVFGEEEYCVLKKCSMFEVKKLGSRSSEGRLPSGDGVQLYLRKIEQYAKDESLFSREGFTYLIAQKILPCAKLNAWDIYHLFKFAKKVPEGGMCLDIGSFMGGSALSIHEGLKAAGVSADILAIEPCPCRELYWNTSSIPRFKLLKETSEKAVKRIPNNSVDLIFLDGNHDYSCVSRDLKNYWLKLKKDGILLGHDYCEEQPGVAKAVEETFKNFSAFEHCKSFMVRKNYERSYC